MGNKRTKHSDLISNRIGLVAQWQTTFIISMFVKLMLFIIYESELGDICSLYALVFATSELIHARARCMKTNCFKQLH